MAVNDANVAKTVETADCIRTGEVITNSLQTVVK